MTTWEMGHIPIYCMCITTVETLNDNLVAPPFKNECTSSLPSLAKGADFSQRKQWRLRNERMAKLRGTQSLF